jgi:hypothetical protein
MLLYVKRLKMSKKSEALMATLLGSDMERVAVIHSAFEDSPRTVAFVEVEKSVSWERKCEVAYVKTNTINGPWWRNEGIAPMFPEATCRSTSVGDMVLIGTEKYKCENDGWSKV